MGSRGREEARPLRVFFIPYFATGHLIPLVDIARLLADRGVESTIVITPANAALIRRTVTLAAESGHPIHTLLYPFPSAEVGLPEGCENLAAVPLSDSHKIDQAILLVQPSHDRILREHRPDCIVSDSHFIYITRIARDLGIPRIAFHAMGTFPIAVMESIHKHKSHLSVTDDTEPFLVPGLPHPVHLLRPELPDFIRFDTEFGKLNDELIEADNSSFGVVVNSFYGLESEFVDYYRKSTGLRTWYVGPLALAYSDEQDKAARGGNSSSSSSSSGNHERCLSWLETKKTESVVYVCFGSWCYFSTDQLLEMAVGLEASGHPFLWVVRDEGMTWLPEGYEERVEGRGLIIKGWAPQLVVLSHPALGCFMSHCGWNSLLEGVGSGVPMLTWPLSTEQFINEKLVLQILRTGVRVWEGFRSTVEEEKVVVPGVDIAAAVARVMGGGEEAEAGMRERAREYGEMAMSAVKVEGSSYNDLSRLIEDIRVYHHGKDSQVQERLRACLGGPDVR